jgi:hypothetical protein
MLLSFFLHSFIHSSISLESKQIFHHVNNFKTSSIHFRFISLGYILWLL